MEPVLRRGGHWPPSPAQSQKAACAMRPVFVSVVSLLVLGRVALWLLWGWRWTGMDALLVLVAFVAWQVVCGEPWPIGLCKCLLRRVEAALRGEPEGTWICALQNSYMPHGGGEEIWFVLRPGGGERRRGRRHYNGPSLEMNTPLLDARAVERVKRRLEAAEAFTLPHHNNPIIDGWLCSLALSDGKRSHAVSMHPPGGMHLELVRFLMKRAHRRRRGPGGPPGGAPHEGAGNGDDSGEMT
jgi:hypothetical protein